MLLVLGAGGLRKTEQAVQKAILSRLKTISGTKLKKTLVTAVTCACEIGRSKLPLIELVVVFRRALLPGSVVKAQI